MLVTHRPSAPLAPFVESIWFAQRGALPHSRELSLPTGRVDIVIPLLQDGVVRFDSIDSLQAIHVKGGVVSGAHNRFAVRGMGGASSVMGVHFKPGGAAAFFGGALGELRNRTVLLDALWGPAARDLRERLQSARQAAEKLRIAEDALLARLPAAEPADAMVVWALKALAQDPAAARIGAVQRASGCSPQRFIRRFEAAVGLAPKRYAQVLRFYSMLPRIAKAGPRDWAAVAAECGYFDQSHLIHDFKRLAGMTPTAYAPPRADQPTHVPVPGFRQRA
jgi:AraC-like DNA-binding protein